MATKNLTSAKAKSKEKAKEPAKEVSKELAKSKNKDSVEKTAKKLPEKATEKSKPASKQDPQPPVPKIMTAKGKESPKKKAASVGDTSKDEKIDPEWTQFMSQSKDVKPVPYSMSEDYEPKSIISHKVLGLGYVIKNQNNRIEVSFKEGKKTLVTNYKK